MTEKEKAERKDVAGKVKVHSSARHLAMVACILIGVFIYAGWKVKMNQDRSSSDQPESSPSYALSNHNQEQDSTAPLRSSASFDDNSAASNFRLPTAAHGAAPDSGRPVLHISSTPVRDLQPEPAPAMPEPTEPPATGVNIPGALPETAGATIGGRSNQDKPLKPIDDALTPLPDYASLPQPAVPSADTAQAARPVTPEAHPATTPRAALPENDTTSEPDNDPELAMRQTIRDGSYSKVYTVKAGDTLNAIAEEIFGDRSKAREIFENNRDLMVSPDQLAIGMKLKIPTEGERQQIIIHTICKSDSLPSLAVRYYGSSERDYINLIRKANPILQKDGFAEGLRLIIPPLAQATTGEENASAQSTYTVQSGDTLSGIARKVYKNSGRWNDIFVANKDTLSSPNSLQVGMKLRIP